MLGRAHEVLTHARVVGVELGQRRQIPPRAIPQHVQGHVSGVVLSLDLSHALAVLARGVGAQLLARCEASLVDVEPIDIWRADAVLDDVMERPEAAP